jgi:Ni/Co efflux regulator RcnB
MAKKRFRISNSASITVTPKDALMKKLLIALISAAVFAAPLALVSTSASAATAKEVKQSILKKKSSGATQPGKSGSANGKARRKNVKK